MPEAPAFVCAAYQNHVLCQCCLHPMPDRRYQAMNNDNTIPPQQCKFYNIQFMCYLEKVVFLMIFYPKSVITNFYRLP